MLDALEPDVPRSAPAAVQEPTADEAALLNAWAASAVGADDHRMATELWDAAGAAADQPVGGRAYAALAGGDPRTALALLVEHGMDDAPLDGPRAPEHVVGVAARAALGDRAELARLLAMGHQQVLSPSAFLRAVVVAADSAGEVAVADRALRSLVADGGTSSARVVGRAIGGWIADRDQEHAGRAVDRVMDGAGLVRGSSPRPWHDTVVLQHAVDTLTRRGDTAGAALLVSAVARTSPQSDDLDALDRHCRPAVRRAARVVPWVVAGVLALGAVPGMLVAIGWLWWIRRVWRAVPDMTRTDEQAWLAIDGLRFDRTLDGAHGAPSKARIVPVVGLVLGLVVGGVLAAQLVSLVAGAWASVPVEAQMLLWLGPLVLAPSAGLLLGNAVLRRYDVATLRARQRREGALAMAAAGTCRCWEISAATGPAASDYTVAHLRPVAVPVASRLRTDRPFDVRQCDLSGVRWLVTTIDGGRTTLLLRGTSPGSGSPVSLAVGGYL